MMLAIAAVSDSRKPSSAGPATSTIGAAWQSTIGEATSQSRRTFSGMSSGILCNYCRHYEASYINVMALESMAMCAVCKLILGQFKKGSLIHWTKLKETIAHPHHGKATT